MINRLIELGVDVAHDPEALMEAVKKGDLGLVISLINAGANIQGKNNKNQTVLDIAVQNKRWHIVEALLKYPALVIDEQQVKSLLNFAIEQDIWSTLKVLIERKVIDVNAPIDHGQTLLQRIVQLNKTNLIQGLIELGLLNIDFKNNLGENLLQMAIKNNNWAIIQALSKHGVKDVIQELSKHGVKIDNHETVLLLAVKNDHAELVQAVMNSVVDVNLKQHLEKMALKEAIRLNKLNMVDTLIQAGAEVNFKKSGEFGDQPLLIDAIDVGNVAILNKLISAGASVDVFDFMGKHALRYAIQQGKLDIILALLKNRVNLNYQNQYGDTALHLAAEKNELKIAQILLDFGANPLLINNNAQKPSDVARFDDMKVFLQRAEAIKKEAIALRTLHIPLRRNVSVFNETKAMLGLPEESFEVN